MRLALILCALLMPLTAWGGESFLPVPYDATKPHALAYAPTEEPEWVAGMLKKNREG